MGCQARAFIIQLHEEQQDVLFARQACDERMELMEQQEAALLRSLATPPQAFAQGLRSAALLLVSRAAETWPKRGEASWLSAVQLLDVASMRLAAPSTERVLARAVAAWLLAGKIAGDNADVHGAISELTVLATEVSCQVGHGEVTPQAIREEEAALLRALDLRLSAPTVACWVRAVLTRFDVFARGLGPCSLEGVEEQALQLAKQRLQSCPVSASYRPRMLALAACGLALAGAGLPAKDALQLAGAEEKDWSMAFLAEGQGAASDTVVGTSQRLGRVEAVAAFRFASAAPAAALAA